MSNGYWYCHYCKMEIDPKSVTFQENCDFCGHPAEWIDPTNNKSKATELLEICKDLSPKQEFEILLLFLIEFSGLHQDLHRKACNICIEQYANAANNCFNDVDRVRHRLSKLFDEAVGAK